MKNNPGLVFEVGSHHAPYDVAFFFERLTSTIRRIYRDENLEIRPEIKLSRITTGNPKGVQQHDICGEFELIRDCFKTEELREFSIGFNTEGEILRDIWLTLRRNSRARDNCLLTVSLSERAESPASWRDLIEVVLGEWRSTLGVQTNLFYRNWQNARKPKFYRLIDEPLPEGFRRYVRPGIDKFFPAEELLDISLNPGRSVDDPKSGSFRRVDAEMWLGPDFWADAPCTKAEVLAADFFLEIRDTPHFLYLKSWPEAFTRPDGQQGRIQQKLWRLLFHEDCEWPPGSGGIGESPAGNP